MATSGGPNIITEGLVFGFDTGYPMVGSGTDTTYKFNKGAPVFNIARELTSWPTRARATVSLYTGSIQPPIPGEAIYKLVCNADNAGILIRDGGYYYAGGNWGSGTVQNTNILSDGTNQYTPLGNNKFVYSLYVHPTENTLDTTYTSIDIGDKNSVNVQNVDDLTDWHKLETTDAVQINSTTYPYDFYDIAYGPNTIGNEILISAVQVLRTPGMDSGSLKTPSPGTQHLTYGAERSFSGSLIDIVRTTDIDLSLMSFDSEGHIEFNGTDNRIDLTLNHLSGSDHSEEVVVYRGSAGTQQGILCDLQYGFYGLLFLSNDKIRYRQMQQNPDGSGGWEYPSVSLDTSDTYGIGTYHIVGTFSKTEGFKLYVNGELKNSNATILPFNLSGNRGINHIGLYKSSNSSTYHNHLDGKLHIVKCYNSALSAAEVKENYNAIKGRFNI